MNTALNPLASRGQRLARALFACTLAGLVGLAGTGCASLSQTVKVDFAEPKIAQAVAPVAVASLEAAYSGSLFNKVSYRPSFEDPRARAVGDSITILIVEKVTASQSSKSTANRSSDYDAGISALPGLKVASLAKLNIGASTSGDFSGKGGTESANTFSGSITATVVDVLPNGHLVVAGEKQIGVNQQVDVMRFSGTIDPRVVQPGNVVNSTQVANARIESRGRGAQAEAQTVGWLTRFFFSFLPF